MHWLCIGLPELALQALARPAKDDVSVPLAIVTRSTRPTIVTCNRAAHALGVRRGIAVAAALALAPQIVIRHEDPSAERTALEGIALWATQFTSTISIAAPFGVLLELSESLRYFGGADALRERIAGGIEELGYVTRLAGAPAPTAALWLARACPGVFIDDVAELSAAIDPLPLGLLTMSGDTQTTLAALGVATVGALAALPADATARRFGQDLFDQIRRARGELPDPQPPFTPSPRFERSLELPSPVVEAEALLFAARRLIAELVGWLRGHGLGVTRIELRCTHKDAEPTAVDIGLSASRDTERIMRVLHERLHRLELVDRVEALTLIASETARLAAENAELLPGADMRRQAHAELVDRMQARLGEGAVRMLAPVADHRPERAWRVLSDAKQTETRRAVGKHETMTRTLQNGLRPLWLLPQPRALGGHPDSLRITLFAGPERIESGWWDGSDVRRDYFVADTPDGATAWIYRDHRYGIDDGEWFMHGLFA